MKRILLFLALFSSFSFAQEATPQRNVSQMSPELENAAFRNPSLPIEKRVDDLVSRMTLEEKVSQMVHVAAAIPRLGIPEYNWWSEGLARRRARGLCDRISAGDWTGCDIRS